MEKCPAAGGDPGGQRDLCLVRRDGAWSTGGKFTIFVNGHAAADCEVVLEWTQFPGRDKNCRLLYNVLFTWNAADSSGQFF